MDLAASQAEGSTVRDHSRAFADQMPAYFRLDLGARLKRNYAHLTTTVGLDIQNTTNRQNVYNRYYNATDAKVEYSRQTGLIPVLFYRVEF